MISSKYLRLVPVTALFVGLSLGLTGCGNDEIPEGNYYGTSDHTALIINSDKTCKYYYEYDPEDGVASLDDGPYRDCTWSKSGDNYTFAGISKYQGTLSATLNDDKSISIPDQGRWNGEIYTKK